MKTPGFWYVPVEEAGPLSALLTPFSLLYGLGTALRLKSGKSKKLPVPVICVGNLTAGGAGKTPVAADLARMALRAGKTPWVLTRGHGGSMSGPTIVDISVHNAAQVGDEAMLLAQYTHVCVAANRSAGADLAMEQGADLIIMDDGFQNPALHKDFSLIVVDGGAGFGNGRMIPAGPLREPVSTGLARADAMVVMGRDRQELKERYGKLLPVLEADLDPPPDFNLWGRRVIGFAGIGMPEKFYATLDWLGAKIVHFHSFPDHHPFSNHDLDELSRQAEKHHAELVTTEKDAMRLPEEFRRKVTIVPVALHWKNGKKITELLAPIMGTGRE